MLVLLAGQSLPGWLNSVTVVFQKLWLYANESALHMKVGIRESGSWVLRWWHTDTCPRGGWSHRRPGRGTSVGRAEPPRYRRVEHQLEANCLKMLYFELAPSNKQNSRRTDLSRRSSDIFVNALFEIRSYIICCRLFFFTCNKVVSVRLWDKSIFQTFNYIST